MEQGNKKVDRMHKGDKEDKVAQEDRVAQLE